MKSETAQHIAGLSNADLWEMIQSEYGTYTQEAIAFAERQWEQRRITQKELAEISVLTTQRASEKAKKADKPLSWPIRILLVLLPIGCVTVVIPIIAHTVLERNGRTRAAHDVWLYYEIGSLVEFIAIVVFLIIFYWK